MGAGRKRKDDGDDGADTGAVAFVSFVKKVLAETVPDGRYYHTEIPTMFHLRFETFVGSP